MSIRLETSKRTGIENFQDHEISAFELNWARSLNASHPRAIARTKPSPVYNCHGLTFASRRTKIIAPDQIQVILRDDSYKEISLEDVKGGDIVIYYSDNGDANHSGIVLAYKDHNDKLLTPIICSKWGNGGEFIHGLNDHPPAVYGPHTKFYRCEL